MGPRRWRSVRPRRAGRGTAMASFVLEFQSESFPHDPQNRGYCVVYRENETNHCPGCGRTHWFVGRVSAECGFCATALPLASATSQGTGGPARSRAPLLSKAA
jgi:hypothetical protein